MAYVCCYKSDKIMKQWTIVVSQNNWEYSGYVTIKANKVERVGDGNRTILADGVEIEFDEEIEIEGEE